MLREKITRTDENYHQKLIAPNGLLACYFLLKFRFENILERENLHQKKKYFYENKCSYINEIFRIISHSVSFLQL
jgi:hypothetical protein